MTNDGPSPDELIRAALQRTAACPPVESLELYLHKADPRIAAHLQSCAYCATELQLLESFHSAEISAEDAAAVNAITQRLKRSASQERRPPQEQPKSWWRFGGSWLRPAMLASAAILVVAAIGLQLRRGGPPELRHIASQTNDVFRAQTVTILSPHGDLQTPPEDVRWEPEPSAVTYQVRLLEVDGHELWTAKGANTNMPFPPAIRALMVPAKTLSLSVEAFNAQGQKVATSGIVSFRILQKIYPR